MAQDKVEEKSGWLDFKAETCSLKWGRFESLSTLFSWCMMFLMYYTVMSGLGKDYGGQVVYKNKKAVGHKTIENNKNKSLVCEDLFLFY